MVKNERQIPVNDEHKLTESRIEENPNIKIITAEVEIAASDEEIRAHGGYITACYPYYKIIECKKLSSKLLPQLFGIAVQELCDMLSKAKHISITCDDWTSDALIIPTWVLCVTSLKRIMIPKMA